jgi:hypothetical protein
MKRLQVHLAVNNLNQNIHLYSMLFACEPTVQHDKDAKRMLDNQRDNFEISNRCANLGLNHLGI